MGNVIYSNMITIDGFMEGLNHSLDWPIIDEELHRFVNQQVKAWDAFLYGRRTYELMAEYWPTGDTNPSSQPYEVEFARIWKAKPKIVFSKSLAKVEEDVRLERSVIPEEILKLKERSDNDLGLGGANLASTFMQLGLIDEYQLYIHPVVLGEGSPAFKELRKPVNLRLVETHKFGSGVIYLRYQSGNEAPYET
jgi:dihydrofolate reductase